MAKGLTLAPPKGPIREKYIDLRDNDDFAEIGMVGPFATAKSTAAIDRLIRRASQYPGSNILMARATLVSLKDSTINKMRQRVGALFEHENLQEATFRLAPEAHPITGLPVESVVSGIGLDRVDLERVLTSTEYSTVFLEEANEIKPEAHDMILERCRQPIYHKTLKVYHLCMKLAAQWGRLLGRSMSADEVYEILSDDPRNRVGQEQLGMDDPMPGRTTVVAVWNPTPNDLVWQRYVGVPYPDTRPTPEWVSKNVGIREVHTEAEELRKDRFEFQAGSIVKLPDGSRMYAAKHDIGTGKVTLIDGRVIDHHDAGLIVQRYCIYAFAYENESRDYRAVENAYLMQDRGMRRRHQQGEFDRREGRVFRNFVDEYTDLRGHKLSFPGRERILRQARANHLRIIGGIDQGGSHATAAVMGLYLPRSKALIIFDEYVRTGESAKGSAYDVQGMLLPGIDYLIGYDPAMNHRIFDNDSEKRQVDNYIEVLGDDNMLPGARGAAAFDEVVDMLSPIDTFIGEEPRPRLLVFDNCYQTIEALNGLTWRMVSHKRTDWRVDVGDAIKIMVSMVANDNIMIEADEVGIVEAMKPRLVYRPGNFQGMNS